MFGTTSFFGIALSPQSLSAGAVVTGLTIATISHIIIAFTRYRKSHSHHDSVLTAINTNIPPILIAGITSLLGFLSMNLSQMPPLKDMGNSSALGIAFSIIYSLTLFPCLLLLFPQKITDHFSYQYNHLFQHWANWLLKKPQKKVFSIMILSIAFSLGNYFNKANDYFAHYYDKSFEFRVANDFADKNLAGLYTLEFDLKPKENESINSSLYLSDLDNFKQWLIAQPEVQHVITLADIIKMMNQVLHNNNAELYNIPEDNTLIAQYLLMYEITLADSEIIEQLTGSTRSSSRVIATITSAPSKDLISLENRSRYWLEQNTSYLVIEPPASIALLLTHIVDDVINSGFKSGLLALVLISIIMLFALKPLALGLISLIPNVLPFIIAFGIWGYFNGNIIASSVIVIAVTLGIVVDDSIHYLYKVRYNIVHENLPAKEAISLALVQTGPAIIITTLCLALAFIVSSFSHFLPSVYFGILTIMILISALILDLTLLPLLVYLYFKRKISYHTNLSAN